MKIKRFEKDHSMEHLLNLFNKAYELLYDGIIEYKEQDQYTDYFDLVLNKDEQTRALIDKFITYRQDMIMSDREAAAFAIAYKLYI